LWEYLKPPTWLVTVVWEFQLRIVCLNCHHCRPLQWYQIWMICVSDSSRIVISLRGYHEPTNILTSTWYFSHPHVRLIDVYRPHMSLTWIRVPPLKYCRTGTVGADHWRWARDLNYLELLYSVVSDVLSSVICTHHSLPLNNSMAAASVSNESPEQVSATFWVAHLAGWWSML
jgi:hypothetical protein